MTEYYYHAGCEDLERLARRHGGRPIVEWWPREWGRAAERDGAEYVDEEVAS